MYQNKKCLSSKKIKKLSKKECLADQIQKTLDRVKTDLSIEIKPANVIVAFNKVIDALNNVSSEYTTINHHSNRTAPDMRDRENP